MAHLGWRTSPVVNRPIGLLSYGLHAKEMVCRQVGCGVAYASLVFVLLGMSAIVWSADADNKLFVCTDSVGAPFDFIPPFVHVVGITTSLRPFVWSFWGLSSQDLSSLPAVAVLLTAYMSGKLILPKEEPPTV